jgi:hypothetical protein
LRTLINYLLLVLISSVKFLGGPIVYWRTQRYGEINLDFWMTNVSIIAGGMLGVSLIIYLSDHIIPSYRKVRHFVEKYFFPKKEIFTDPTVDVNQQIEVHYDYVERRDRKRKVFTPRNRRIIKLWRKFGLIGITALTPVLFSIPIGTFIITRLEHNHRKVLLYMFISITIWSFLLTGVFEYYHIHSIPEIISE